MNAEIKNFFYPSKIAVVGASQKEKSIGYELLRSIKNYGFNGEIYPVNPNADFLLGYKCYKSIPELPDGIDLAIVVVPKQFVDDSLDNVLLKNIKSVILITAGFKEVGLEGAEFEHKIIEKIRASGARLVGPNCMGVINTLKDIRLNATFVAEKPETGCTAFLSQSGAIGAAVLNSLRETDIKFGHFISVGNKADICENDLLEFWQSDDNIMTI
ncbi:MAG TPA: CoA-binding protein, partial [Ignavibacteriaceae bacterium]|nr:CoA-binding protein [Ignavibacteriaceae bacterium]